jgi:aurora kinase
LPNQNKEIDEIAYNAKADVWAIGILAYEILMGYPPFEQESRRETYDFIMKSEVNRIVPQMTSDRSMRTARCRSSSNQWHHHKATDQA